MEHSSQVTPALLLGLLTLCICFLAAEGNGHNMPGSGLAPGGTHRAGTSSLGEYSSPLLRDLSVGAATILQSGTWNLPSSLI